MSSRAFSPCRRVRAGTDARAGIAKTHVIIRRSGRFRISEEECLLLQGATSGMQGIRFPTPETDLFVNKLPYSAARPVSYKNRARVRLHFMMSPRACSQCRRALHGITRKRVWCRSIFVETFFVEGEDHKGHRGGKGGNLEPKHPAFMRSCINRRKTIQGEEGVGGKGESTPFSDAKNQCKKRRPRQS